MTKRRDVLVYCADGSALERWCCVLRYRLPAVRVHRAQTGTQLLELMASGAVKDLRCVLVVRTEAEIGSAFAKGFEAWRQTMEAHAAGGLAPMVGTLQVSPTLEYAMRMPQLVTTWTVGSKMGIAEVLKSLTLLMKRNRGPRSSEADGTTAREGRVRGRAA